jgi:hypothetical protein
MRVLAPLAAGLVLATAAARVCLAAPEPSSGTTRFVLDGDRIYAELAFVRPDGSLHRSLAYVDMGVRTMSLSQSLIDELGLDASRPLRFQVGALPVTVPATTLEHSGKAQRLGSETVDGVLPAGVLRNYQVVLDYRRRELTLAEPGTLRPTGVATPFHLSGETGLLAVDATIDGRPYAITVDAGSAWTWVRQSAVKDWLADQPAWARGVGAVGPSNMMMVGDLEASGLRARIPSVRIGDLTLKQVDVLGPGASTTFPFELFDWYSKKNALPVLGWIGGNVLKAYRLTIDYPNHTLYWQRQAGPDIHELDRIGLTLRTQKGDYVVAGVATRDGLSTVAGVQPGDKLVQVDGLTLKGATWGAIFGAMQGTPGEQRRLVLDRAGQPVTVLATVMAF